MKIPTVTEHCVITGASSGLGAEFARQLAPRAKLLSLVARRGDRLEELAATLRRGTDGADGPRCRILALDLGAPAAAEQLSAWLAEEGTEVDLLVNNAGYGRYGAFDVHDADDYTAMITLNVSALTELARHLVPQIKNKPGRGIINVASRAGYQPVPYFAVYAATKAYVRSFSAALAHELEPHGARVHAFCPGHVPTEFGQVAGERPGVARPGPTPESVVRGCLRAYEKGRLEYLPGFGNRVLRAMTPLLPQRLVMRLAALAMRERVDVPG